MTEILFGQNETDGYLRNFHGRFMEIFSHDGIGIIV